jgi:hypothetical protein
VSVNYYLDSPHNEAGHLGKWASGRFTAKAPDGVNSFDDWAAQLDGRRIFAEHGIEYSAAEMIAEALDRQPYASLQRNARHDQGEFIDRGILFVRYDFC